MTPWTAPLPHRPAPDRTLAEREALQAMLDYHRATLLTKCSGLTEDQLKTLAVPPSTLTLLGLVRHLREVEMWWLRHHVASEDVSYPYFTEADPDADFEAIADADARADLAGYEAEILSCDAAAGAHALDEIVQGRHGSPPRVMTVRWIYLHLIEEYARHNGHADLLREAIDGATGD